jgi:DNA polymerase III epsilon subunit-like protein
MYIAWDTETTGLPRVRTTPTPKNLHNYDTCRIVSLAAVKYSSRGRELASFHRIVKPDGYRVEATEVHGITHDHAMEHGTPFARVFEEFMEFVGPVETLVAHNSRFDENVLTSEVLRIGEPLPFDKFTFVCTNNMHKETEFSPIKLIDLYTKIFGHGFDGAHDALNDARACGEVYPRMQKVERVHKPIGVPKVIIKASDVPSIMGLSQFKRAPDVVEELWRKYLPDTCTMKSKDERAMEVIDGSVVLRDIKKRAQSSTAEAQSERMALLDEVEDTDITPAQKGLVKDHLRKFLYPPRHEERGGSDTFYRYNVCSIEGTLYQIVGRVDRLRPNEDGTYTLVEIKNRAKGLFKRLRDYEEAQCRAYLAMMPPSVKDCLLVEAYEGEMRSYRVERDVDKWKPIASRVHEFCKYFHHVVSTS